MLAGRGLHFQHATAWNRRPVEHTGVVVTVPESDTLISVQTGPDAFRGDKTEGFAKTAIYRGGVYGEEQWINIFHATPNDLLEYIDSVTCPQSPRLGGRHERVLGDPKAVEP